MCISKPIYLSVYIRWILCFFLISTNALAQTDWVKDANNPVLARDTVIANLPNDLIAISDPWVIKEGTVYKMWYTCGGLNYPTDTELRSRICYCTSTDGLNWDKYVGNPVMDVSYDGLWDSLGVETVSIIIDPSAVASERYKMWYAGQYFNDYRYDIGYAFSPDGISWTKHAAPVLQVGTASEWDNGFLEGPSVLKEAGVYKMWYCGYDVVVDGSGTDGNTNIGLATSTDGINWTKHPNNPIFTTGTNTWDSHYVQDPHVINDNGVYYMWYGGNDVEGYGQQVGLATSSDGVSWIKSPINPVLQKGSIDDWDANTASFPSVLKSDNIYEMWYTGKDIAELVPNDLDYYWEVGYASSTITSVMDMSNAANDVMQLFPNPAQSELQITLAADVSKANLVIYNQIGQVTLNQANVSTGSLLIDASSFSAGLYSVVLFHGNSKSVVKFVKAD
jgi:predicted GH43/DUF377 family glycosyl hydrolase